MVFALGYLAGLMTALIVFVVIAFFKQPVENTVERLYREIQQNAKQVGIGQRGYLFEPEDDDEIARQEIIAENTAKGRDTPISELR